MYSDSHIILQEGKAALVMATSLYFTDRAEVTCNIYNQIPHLQYLQSPTCGQLHPCPHKTVPITFDTGVQQHTIIA